MNEYLTIHMYVCICICAQIVIQKIFFYFLLFNTRVKFPCIISSYISFFTSKYGNKALFRMKFTMVKKEIRTLN